MPLALCGPKAFFFSSGSAQETSPACLAGRGPFVQFLQSTLQYSTWNFFFLRYCLWLVAGQRLFSFPPARPRNQPGLSGREGAFCPISCKAPFNVPRGTFSFFGIAFGSQQTKGFFFSSGSAQETSPACLAGRGPFVRLHPQTHPNVPHGTFFTFQNAKKLGFVRFACFHPPASVL